MFFSRCPILLTYLLYILDKSTCSRVIDAVSQRSVYVSEYCPSMKYCKDGTHVMCMFYDKDKEMGPHCLNSPNITVTPLLASKFLEIANAIRSKVALGKEKGKGNAPLPRGYGMLRLEWDEELATFAQVLANQCVLRHDICRATKTFSDPGQTAGLVRYTYPDWNSISRSFTNGEDDTPGLNEEKLIYAIKQSTKSWYIQKASVSTQMIINYPDWLLHPTKHAGKLYLEMITGHATHMGCGMSAYTEYTYRNTFAVMNYNSVQVICNFSARPTPGTSVYNLQPPIDTRGCGCPEGYEEDEDCLCNESGYRTIRKQKAGLCKGRNCVPPIVLLPIIAMEDAPLHKLKSRRYNNNTQELTDNFDIFTDNIDNTIRPEESNTGSDFENTLRAARNSLQQASLSLNKQNKKNIWKLHNGNFGKNQLVVENGESIQESPDQVRPSATQIARQSIFSKVNNFKLPIKVSIKKDVLPRKDFTKVQNLVNKYLNKKRNITVIHPNSKLDITRRTIQPSNLNITMTDYATTDYNDILTNDSISNVHVDYLKENSDKKVMHLLDNLEQEVGHINLDDNEKEILDNKLRKIYGRISNDPKDLTTARKLKGDNYKSKIKEELRDDFLKFENRVNLHLLNEQRDPQIYRGRSNRRSLNYDDLSNVQNPLDKDKGYDENIGNLKERLENPINYNDYSSNPKYDKRLNTRTMNALVEYNHGHNDMLRDLTNIGDVNDDINKQNFRNTELPDERYTSKYDDDVKLKSYYIRNRLVNDGQLNYKRRKYYQDKLDYIERKLQKARNNIRFNKANENRALRPFLAERTEVAVRPNQQKENENRALRPFQPDRKERVVRQNQQKVRKNVFYMPDRARSVHGF